MHGSVVVLLMASCGSYRQSNFKHCHILKWSVKSDLKTLFGVIRPVTDLQPVQDVPHLREPHHCDPESYIQGPVSKNTKPLQAIAERLELRFHLKTLFRPVLQIHNTFICFCSFEHTDKPLALTSCRYSLNNMKSQKRFVVWQHNYNLVASQKIPGRHFCSVSGEQIQRQQCRPLGAAALASFLVTRQRFYKQKQESKIVK